MDFSSLGENSPIYIIRKKPFQFVTGSLKSKGTKPLTANPFMPQPQQQNIDVVVTVNGSDEILPAVPINRDTIEYKGSFYSVSADGIQNAVANMMQLAKGNLDEHDYYKSVLTEGEKIMEQLNPQYAEGKRQARTIADLQERADKQDKKLDEILTFMRELNGGSPKN